MYRDDHAKLQLSIEKLRDDLTLRMGAMMGAYMAIMFGMLKLFK